MKKKIKTRVTIDQRLNPNQDHTAGKTHQHLQKKKTIKKKQKKKYKKIENSVRERERKKPVVRALIMPALRPLKSRKTASTVRGLDGGPAAAAAAATSMSFFLLKKKGIEKRKEKEKGIGIWFSKSSSSS